MAGNTPTRRKFVRNGAITAAALNATYTVEAGNPDKAHTSKILCYNGDMEYRRCGRTGWMVLAVCLGGHAKRRPPDHASYLSVAV